jgi:hypothetical protein
MYQRLAVFQLGKLEYSGVGVTTVSTKYCIEPAGNQFIVIDPWSEQLVHTYPTEDAARQDSELCMKEDAMWETAKLLVDAAIKVRMEIHGVDRGTAAHWVNCSLGRV